MNRTLAFAATLFGFVSILPSSASAQNLEAGKSPGQLFNNTCTACHRSPRGLLRTVPPGSLPGFLREHYTTSRDMAQQLAGFLISNGAADTRGRPQEARQQPAGAEPSRQQPAGTEPPRQSRPGEPEPQARQRPPDPNQRPQRPVEQAQPSVPAEAPPSARLDPRAEARQARRERRAKREAEQAARAAAATESARKDANRRNRITPARIEAATERGKDALPLGSIVTVDPAAEPVRPEVVAPSPQDASKSATSAPPPEPVMRNDPVPQVTPAPASNAEVPTGSSAVEISRGSEVSRGSDDTPAAAEPAPTSGPPPVPPISN